MDKSIMAVERFLTSSMGQRLTAFLEGWFALENQIKKYGLFVVTLNNGDWMVGKSNIVYSLNPGLDHYIDDRLSISPYLSEAIDNWIKVHEKKGDTDDN